MRSLIPQRRTSGPRDQDGSVTICFRFQMDRNPSLQ
jgi:hypothetical protein